MTLEPGRRECRRNPSDIMRRDEIGVDEVYSNTK